MNSKVLKGQGEPRNTGEVMDFEKNLAKISEFLIRGYLNNCPG